MFCLADMMTCVEVGISLARKAKRLIQDKLSQAKKIVIMCRIFASEVAELIAGNAIKIVAGSGLAHEEIPSTLKERMCYEEFTASCSGLIQDMDAVADILFGRE
jgi:alkylation response protein AidB-like acyl-CoA dehydrogenase